MRSLLALPIMFLLVMVSGEAQASNRYLDWLNLFKAKNSKEIGLNLTGSLRSVVLDTELDPREEEISSSDQTAEGQVDGASDFLTQSWKGIGAEVRIGYEPLKFINVGIGGKYDGLRGATAVTDNLFSQELYGDITFSMFFLFGNVEFGYGYSMIEYEFLKTDTYYNFAAQTRFSNIAIEIPLSSVSLYIKRDRKVFQTSPINQLSSELTGGDSLDVKSTSFSFGLRVWI